MGKKRQKRKGASGEDESPASPHEPSCEQSAETAESNLKRRKSRSKAAFTRARHELLQLLEEDLPSRTQVRAAREKLNTESERVMEDLSSLADIYSAKRDSVNVMEKLSQEMEKIEEEFAAAQNRTQEYLDARKDELSSIASGASVASLKVRQAQNEELNARRYAEQLEAKLLKEQEDIRIEKQRIEQEYASKMKELEDRNRQGKELLNEAKEEAERKHAAVESKIDEELGLDGSERSVQAFSLRLDDSEGHVHQFSPRRRVESRHPEEAIRERIERSPAVEIGQDLWKQLKKVSIPVFSGEKSTYESWKAAFVACIDKAPATPEYKLLQLRQYLSGEALKVIENLGHSASAYEAAKSRLERKYGGERRQITLYLEELENFKPIRPGYPKDVEKFADLLDIAYINLKEAKRYEELGNGSLYTKLQKKMTEQMLTAYHKWVFENSKCECVDTLRDWVIQEAEFQTIAAETLRGVSSSGHQRRGQTYFGTKWNQPKNSEEQSGNKKRPCKVCEENHPIWVCDSFKGMTVSKRWETAKKHRLCYRCLGDNHVGQSCRRTRICGLNGCTETHNRLLHDDKPFVREQMNNQRASETGDQPQTSSSSAATEGEYQHNSERSHTTRAQVKEKTKDGFVGLRTVPVILKNGSRSVVVNGLLDDASTKTYINSDVAAELGLQGTNRQVTVNVLNGQEDTFETMPVNFVLESLDGKVNKEVSAFTEDRVTGNMKVVKWAEHGKKCSYLKGMNFPHVGPRPIVDILRLHPTFSSCLRKTATAR